jgi:hypothetical protein
MIFLSLFCRFFGIFCRIFVFFWERQKSDKKYKKRHKTKATKRHKKATKSDKKEDQSDKLISNGDKIQKKRHKKRQNRCGLFVATPARLFQFWVLVNWFPIFKKSFTDFFAVSLTSRSMIKSGLPSGARLRVSDCAFLRGAAQFLELLSLLDDEGAFRRFRAVDIMWLSKDKLACFIFASFWTMGARLGARWRANGGKPRTVECSRQTFTGCTEKSKKKDTWNFGCYDFLRTAAAHAQAAAVYCAPSQLL